MRNYQRMRWNNLFSYILILFALIMTSCSKVKKQEPEEVILAQIGDVTISLNEFIRRTELTIRPNYCNGDDNIHKKIILNSLIAEKMLALEAGESNALDQDEQFQLYLQGRQEQIMREQFLNKEVYQKVKLDESEIQAEYDVAGRSYNIQYFSILDDNIASRLNEELINSEGFFEELHQQLWPGEDLPERKVEWKSRENPRIHDALFSKQPIKGTVIGPVRIAANNYIIMKVLGWTDELAVSEAQKRERLDTVKEKLMMEKSQQDYVKYVVRIMAGKKLEFNPQILERMVEIVKPFYMLLPDEKKELFKNATFNQSDENPELDQLAEGISDILEEPLFSIDGESWTVKKFMEELQRHPLVFRNKIRTENDFEEQYKLAVVDLVRDHYLTKEAYKCGMQDTDVVKRSRQMWHDALLAQFQMNNYLQYKIPNLTEAIESDSLNTSILIDEYLNPYIDQLQTKYSSRIRINVEEFNKIRLTRTDMVAIQKNVPFTVMVPAFPQVTTDHKLDYGSRME